MPAIARRANAGNRPNATFDFDGFAERVKRVAVRMLDDVLDVSVAWIQRDCMPADAPDACPTRVRADTLRTSIRMHI
jgi:hypothetical protein